jgi:hypothetical protein
MPAVLDRHPHTVATPGGHGQGNPRGAARSRPAPRRGDWYQKGRVDANQALYTAADALEGFYPMSPDFKPDQTIGSWVDAAAAAGTWPKVCAPLPAAG